MKVAEGEASCEAILKGDDQSIGLHHQWREQLRERRVIQAFVRSSEDAVRFRPKHLRVCKIDLDAHSLSRSPLDTERVHVRHSHLERVWRGPWKASFGTAGDFEWMNLKKARPLSKRKLYDPAELVNVVLGQCEDETEWDTRFADGIQPARHSVEGMLRGADPVVGGGDSIKADGQKI